MTNRDFELLERAAASLETTSQLAEMAKIALGRSRPNGRGPNARAIRDVRDMVARFCDLVVGVQSAAVEYHDAMNEADLRAWAARVVTVVRS